VAQQVIARLALVNTAQACAEAVKIVYTLGGATSIYTSSRLERCFRDAHVVPAHITVAYTLYERTGKFFLGLGYSPFG
jgi:hypothetical protein